MGALLYPSGSTSSAMRVRSGVIPAGVVSSNGPLRVVPGGGLSINIVPGRAIIQGASSDLQGQYLVSNDANVNHPLAAAHATLPRIDVVYTLVTDTSFSGGSDDTVSGVTTGTPSASPTAPTPPTGAFVLAHVAVPAAATVTNSGDITDKRVYTVSSGAVLPVLSSARPTNAYDGQEIYETDTGARKLWNTTEWRGYRMGTTCTNATRPAAPKVGDSIMETDTGREYVRTTIAAVNYWVPRPGSIVAVLHQTTSQSLTNGVAAFMLWQTVLLDLWGGLNVGTPSRYSPNVPGWYELAGGASFLANGTGTRSVGWAKNGTTENATAVAVTPLSAVSTITVARPHVIYLNGTSDYVEMTVTQSSGGSLSTNATTTQRSVMTVKYLGS